MSARAGDSGGELRERLPDFLLHEFDHVGAALLHNEDAGERRVQFFLAVATAVFGLIGLAFRAENEPIAQTAREWALPISIGLVALLIFGLATLLRIIERNVATDRYKYALRALRRRFVSSDLASAHPAAFFEPYTEPKQRRAWSSKGGWLEVVALLNASILLLIGWLLANRLVPPSRRTGAIDALVVGVPVLLFLLVFIGQLVVANRKFEEEHSSLADKDRRTDTIKKQGGQAN